MPAQVDGARCDVDVHEVIHDSALDVILDSVHQVPPAHVDDLYEGQLSLKKKKNYIKILMRKIHFKINFYERLIYKHLGLGVSME